MNRTQKKCVVASAGLHLLLLVILFIGPAFLSSKNHADDLQVLTFVPLITTDERVSGGGNPEVKLPPPPPPPVPPAPKQEPSKATARETRPDPTALDPRKADIIRRPVINTQLVARVSTPSTTQKRPASDTKAANDRSKAFNDAARRIQEGSSSSTAVEMPGTGGGGPTYANYRQTVGSVYYQAWVEPDDTTADEATVLASVTIARDGTVISARIVTPSGNAAADRSVQATLDRVKFVAPFPEGAKEERRTFPINFNLKARKLLG